MSDLFNSEPSEKNPVEDLCVVYILYFDEEKGHVPLLIYPSEKYKDNKTYMRPIKYHSVWFLDVEDKGALDHIDLEFKGYTFFGKKFLTTSKRKKRRAGLEEDTPETIVIIVSLPNELEIFGDELIRSLTAEIKDKFENKLFKLIEWEYAKEAVIKTPLIKERIQEGTKIKLYLRQLIEEYTKDYFSKVLKKEATSDSIKKQKAISYLSLKGIEYSHLAANPLGKEFTDMELFDPQKTDDVTFAQKTPISISDINLIEDSQEIEIMVRNNTKQELQGITITITHVKEFFEKEVMNQKVDFWFPDEELLFISPIIPHINEYLFFIIKDNDGTERLLSRKIDINNIDKIKS